MIDRIRGWVALSKQGGAGLESGAAEGGVGGRGRTIPDFPLVPASRGFCITVENLLDRFNRVIGGL